MKSTPSFLLPANLAPFRSFMLKRWWSWLRVSRVIAGLVCYVSAEQWLNTYHGGISVAVRRLITLFVTQVLGSLQGYADFPSGMMETLQRCPLYFRRGYEVHVFFPRKCDKQRYFQPNELPALYRFTTMVLGTGCV